MSVVRKYIAVTMWIITWANLPRILTPCCEYRAKKSIYAHLFSHVKSVVLQIRACTVTFRTVRILYFYNNFTSLFV